MVDSRVYHTAFGVTYPVSCNILDTLPKTHLKRDKKENFHSIISHKKITKKYFHVTHNVNRESATWRQRNMPT